MFLKKTLFCFFAFVLFSSSGYPQDTQDPVGSVTDPSINIQTIQVEASIRVSEHSGMQYVVLKVTGELLTTASNPRLVLRGSYPDGYDLFNSSAGPRLAVISKNISTFSISPTVVNFELSSPLSLQTIRSNSIDTIYFGIGDSEFLQLQLQDSWHENLGTEPRSIVIDRIHNRNGASLIDSSNTPEGVEI